MCLEEEDSDTEPENPLPKTFQTVQKQVQQQDPTMSLRQRQFQIFCHLMIQAVSLVTLALVTRMKQAHYLVKGRAMSRGLRLGGGMMSHYLMHMNN